MPKPADPVKIAKLISKATNVRLARVAQIMQEHPLDAHGHQKALADCEKPAALYIRDVMNKTNPF